MDDRVMRRIGVVEAMMTGRVVRCKPCRLLIYTKASLDWTDV